ncbi:MAG: RNA methyltransferase [Pseudomonadota bacterium]
MAPTRNGAGDGIGVYKHITSTGNQAVKEAARLGRKRHRHDRRQFLTEGEDLLDAALARGVIPRQVFAVEGTEEDIADRFTAAGLKWPGKVELFSCSPPVMEKLSALGSGSRVAAVFDMVDRKFPGVLESATASGPAGERAAGIGPVLYLAGVADPGNVGTIMRSAAAMGAAAVLMGPGTADPYSPKSLRATMGAVFQLPFFLTVNPATAVSWAERSGFPVIAAQAHAGKSVWDADLSDGFVLVLGSEREGVPHRLAEAAQGVRIPQEGGAESLNVAMAATAILCEAARQRVKVRGDGGSQD